MLSKQVSPVNFIKLKYYLQAIDYYTDNVPLERRLKQTTIEGSQHNLISVEDLRKFLENPDLKPWEISWRADGLSSLDSYVNGHRDKISIPEWLNPDLVLASVRWGEILEKYRKQLAKIIEDKIFPQIPIREKIILKLRFGFYDETYNPQGKGHTLEDIRKIMGISRGRVNQIEERAKDRVRQYIKRGINRHQFDESDFTAFL